MTPRDSSQQAYSVAVGTNSTNYPVIDKRDPNPNDIYYPLGKFWINQAGIRLWYLNSQSNISGALQSTWELISVSTVLASLSDTGNTVVFPSSTSSTPPDNIQLVGGTGITVVATPGSNLLTITNTGTASTETLTGDDGIAVIPFLGTIRTLGQTVANATFVKPLYTNNPSSNIEQFNIQVAAAIPSTAMNSTGLSAFSNAQFAVDANGFVTLAGGSTAPVLSLTPNSGTSPVLPVSGTINVKGTGSITTVGTPGQVTVELTGLTANSVLYGLGTATVGLVTASPNGVLISSAANVPSWLADGTTGQVLTATAGSPPSWQNAGSSSVTFTGDSGTPFAGNAVTVTGDSTGLTFVASNPNLTMGGDLNVAHGGTGNTTFTAFSIIAAGTTATGPFQNVSGIGAAGQVLTSSGSGLPTWQNAAASSVTSVSGTNGVTASPTTGAVIVSGVNATSSTVGVASFNATDFTVSGAGAVTSNAITVSLSGGLTGSSSVNLGGTLTLSGGAGTMTGLTPDSFTGSGTSPVLPTAGGLITVTGGTGPNYTTGTTNSSIRTVSTAPNSLTIEAQLAGANPTTATANNFGVAQFNSNQFGVTGGYVTSNNFTINAGAGLSGGGTITLGGSTTLSLLSAGFVWQYEAISFAAVSNNGYFVTAIATAALPAAPVLGDVIKIQSQTASVVTILANTGQKIRVGNVISALAGTAKSTKIGDAMELVYSSSDATWYSNVSPVGSWGIT